MRTEAHHREKETTKEQLIGQFRTIGLKSGDAVLVHSSYSSIGKVVGGPDALIDALLEVVGPEGHVMFPAFDFRKDQPPFDPAVSPTTMGAIPETARKRATFLRSDLPANSVIVSGPHAAWIAENHASRGHLRPGDPIDRLAMLGGYVMLLGVSFRSNTTVHIGECIGDLPHRRISKDGPYVMMHHVDGDRGPYNLSGGPECSEAFGAVEGIMRERNHIVDGYIGVAPTKLMRGKDIISDTVDLIHRAPWALYCNNPECAHCVRNRRIVLEEYLERKRHESTFP